MKKLVCVVFTLLLLSSTLAAREDSYVKSRLKIIYPDSIKSATKKQVKDFQHEYARNPEKTVYTHALSNVLRDNPEKAAGIMRAITYRMTCEPNCSYEEMFSSSNAFSQDVKNALELEGTAFRSKELLKAGYVDEILKFSEGLIATSPGEMVAGLLNNSIRLLAQKYEEKREALNSDIDNLYQEDALQFLQYEFKKDLAAVVYEKLNQEGFEGKEMLNKYINVTTNGRISIDNTPTEFFKKNPELAQKIVQIQNAAVLMDNTLLLEESNTIIADIQTDIAQGMENNQSEHDATQSAMQKYNEKITKLQKDTLTAIESSEVSLFKAMTKGNKSLKTEITSIKVLLNNQELTRAQKEKRLEYNAFYAQIDNRYSASGFAVLRGIKKILAEDNPELARGITVGTVAIQSVFKLKNSIQQFMQAKNFLKNQGKIIQGLGAQGNVGNMFSKGMSLASGAMAFDFINVGLTIAGLFMESGPSFEESVMNELAAIQDQIMELKQDIHEVKVQITELHEFVAAEFDESLRVEDLHFDAVMEKFDQVALFFAQQHVSIQEAVTAAKESSFFAKSSNIYIKSLSNLVTNLLTTGFERRSFERFELISDKIERASIVEIDPNMHLNLFSEMKTEIVNFSRDAVAVGTPISGSQDLTFSAFVDRFDRNLKLSDDFVVEAANFKLGIPAYQGQRIPDQDRASTWMNLLDGLLNVNKDKVNTFDLADLEDVKQSMADGIQKRIDVLKNSDGLFDGSYVENQLNSYKENYKNFVREVSSGYSNSIKTSLVTPPANWIVPFAPTIRVSGKVLKLPLLLLQNKIPKKIKTYIYNNPHGFAVNPKIVWTGSVKWTKISDVASDTQHDLGMFKTHKTTMLPYFRYTLSNVKRYASPTITIVGTLVDQNNNKKVVETTFSKPKGILFRERAALKKIHHRKSKWSRKKSRNHFIPFLKYDQNYTAFNYVEQYPSQNTGVWRSIQCLKGKTDKNWCNVLLTHMKYDQDHKLFRTSDAKTKAKEFINFIKTKIVEPRTRKEPTVIEATKKMENIFLNHANYPKWVDAPAASLDQGDWTDAVNDQLVASKTKNYVESVKRSFVQATMNLTEPENLVGVDFDLVDQLKELRGEKLMLLASLDTLLPEVYDQIGFDEVLQDLFSIDKLAQFSDIELTKFLKTSWESDDEHAAFGKDLFENSYQLLEKLVINTLDKLKYEPNRMPKFGKVAIALENLNDTIEALKPNVIQ